MLQKMKSFVKSTRLYAWLREKEAKSPSSFWIMVAACTALVLDVSGLALVTHSHLIVGGVLIAVAMGCILITVPLNGG